MAVRYGYDNTGALATVTKDGVTWTNTYDSDGMRTKRTNGTNTYSYIYNGGSLSQMTVDGTVMNFAYDASGTPMAVTYGGATYYYATNIQGDVVAILNASGTAVVTYTYDAWGNILTATGTLASTLGTHNPLRYRGYVYDPETGLYYLQSRYYNPQMGRFICADSLVSTGQGLLGNNMFAYCGNNPVARIDASGYLYTDTFAVNMEDIGRKYIINQHDESVGTKRFGLFTVSHGGCGIVASYNALISLGNGKDFNDVLSYYNSNISETIGWGATGLIPFHIVNYFEELGYAVITTDDLDFINILSARADACILYYEFYATYDLGLFSIDAYGAHFVEYSKNQKGYMARNTSENGGNYMFNSPSHYGLAGDRYTVQGIFIYK